jgi:hypothetical protein
MDDLQNGETDPDGPMVGHGDSQALPIVFCAPEAATPWVPVTSPIPTLTPLPAVAPAPTFPLPTDVPALATLPPHGETEPDGPMGGDGASEPIDGAEALHAAPCTAAVAAHFAPSTLQIPPTPFPADWHRRSRRAKKYWVQSHPDHE